MKVSSTAALLAAVLTMIVACDGGINMVIALVSLFAALAAIAEE